MSHTVKILIADDHKLISQALASVLKATGDYEVSYATSLQEVFQALGQDEFEILLLDLRMPGMVGLSSVSEVVRKAPETAVVLFTGSTDEVFVRQCVELGAKGYIPKTMDLDAVHFALQLISAGQRFIPYDVTKSSNAAGNERNSNLTERELLVLQFAADGHTNKEIARELASSETLVKMIMRNICGKLGAKNRANACIIGRERLLI